MGVQEKNQKTFFRCFGRFCQFSPPGTLKPEGASPNRKAPEDSEWKCIVLWTQSYIRCLCFHHFGVVWGPFWDQFRTFGDRFWTFLVPIRVQKPPWAPLRALVTPKLAPRPSPERPFGAFGWPFVPQSPSQEPQRTPKWCLFVSLWARFLVLVPLFLLCVVRRVKTCSQEGSGAEF